MKGKVPVQYDWELCFRVLQATVAWWPPDLGFGGCNKTMQTIFDKIFNCGVRLITGATDLIEFSLCLSTDNKLIKLKLKDNVMYVMTNYFFFLFMKILIIELLRRMQWVNE